MKKSQTKIFRFRNKVANAAQEKSIGEQALLPNDPTKTGKTGKTGETAKVSNKEFLQAVFGSELADACPVVISFESNPNNAFGKDWIGKPWKVSADTYPNLSSNMNNYFSLAAFTPDEAGQYRRQKKCFYALYAVMLDDVGTKVPMDRLILSPSWIVETSKDNYQAGYLLRNPLSDGAIADRLMKVIVAAGLCDPGAAGPQARLARLPVAVNGKHTPPFQCNLAKWQPELRYSVQEIVDGLQLESVEIGRSKRSSTRLAQERPSAGDLILIPRPTENVVLTSLRDRNLYKSPKEGNMHDITCPWVTEHTDELDHGTAYYEPGDLYPIGGFHCFHGHCSERHIRDLLNFLGIDANAARMKPTIRIVPGEISSIVDAAERELAQSNLHYQRGGLIVAVVTDPSTHETRVQEISQQALVRALADVATWERFDGRVGDWARVDPPSRHVAVLFDSTSYAHLPILKGLARQPYLRPDGTLMMVAGYDPSTSMFGVFNAQEFSILENPTPADALVALSLLQDVLREFSFAHETDMAAALAAILTATVRPSLDHAPMIHVRAHMVGSGKSYLCEVITAFATPQRGTPTTFPADDEECRKLLLAELLRAPAVIEFDNLTSDLLSHKSLCTALTSEYTSGRILGVSKTATVSTRTLFLSSGNNVGPIQDMTRRCITINLDPGCEVPATRNFNRPHLVHDVLKERGRYISAALTIVRAWITAGRPSAACKPLVGYRDWSEFCQQPLLWLGLPDPTVSVFQAMSEDPQRETLGRLLTAWQSAFGKSSAMVRDVVSYAAKGHKDLQEVLNDIAEERGEINRRKLGRWIKRHSGCIVEGRRFIRDNGNRSAEAWRVHTVSPVSPVSSAPDKKVVKPATKTTEIQGQGKPPKPKRNKRRASSKKQSWSRSLRKTTRPTT